MKRQGLTCGAYRFRLPHTPQIVSLIDEGNNY